MHLALDADMENFIRQKVRAGEYATPEDVVRAGLAKLMETSTREFAPGEFNALLGVGQADIDRGDIFDGDEVFNEIRRMGAERRKQGNG